MDIDEELQQLLDKIQANRNKFDDDIELIVQKALQDIDNIGTEA